MRSIGYYNGVMGPVEELQVPMRDRAMFFGDGAYEVTFAYNQIPFALEDHLDRFWNSLRMLEITPNFTREFFKQELQRCIEASESKDVLSLYWQTSRGNGKRNHVYPTENEPTLMIIVEQGKNHDFHKPLKLMTMQDTRFMHCNIKSLNLLPNVMAAQKAKEAGCDEAILCRGNLMMECSHDGLLILKDGVLIGPILDERVLPSISRKHLFEIAHELGMATEERDVTIEEVMNADEVIVCSSTKLAIPADTIDDIAVGMKDQEHLKKLQNAYFKRVEDACGWHLE